MAGRVRLETRPGDGRERIRHHDGQKEVYVYVHRLAAYAWAPDLEFESLWAAPEGERTGDPRTGKLGVHHATPIAWLNAEWNLEWKRPGEHGRIESGRRERDAGGAYARARPPPEPGREGDGPG